MMKATATAMTTTIATAMAIHFTIFMDEASPGQRCLPARHVPTIAARRREQSRRKSLRTRKKEAPRRLQVSVPSGSHPAG
jgi:hypothetical protein